MAQFKSPSTPECGGDIGHDLPDTSAAFPIKIGGVAKAQDGTTPGTVAENDRVDARFDQSGSQFVNIGHPYYFQTTMSFAAAQTATEVATAPGASLSYYITDIGISSDTSCTFTVLEATGAAVNKWVLALIGGGAHSHSFRCPLKLTANTNLGITTSATTTHFNVSGYIAP